MTPMTLTVPKTPQNATRTSRQSETKVNADERILRFIYASPRVPGLSQAFLGISGIVSVPACPRGPGQARMPAVQRARVE